MTLSVLIPIYNEKKFLAQSLDRLIKTNLADEIILVDDCSTDGSLEIARSYSQNFSNIFLVQTKINLGKGGALSAGAKFISCDFTVVHDADLEYDPNDLKGMLNLLSENSGHLILGTRFRGKQQRINIYKRTFLANKFLSLFFSFINLKNVSDVATCYKMMSSEDFKSINITENGFAVEIEVLSKFLRKNKAIKEYPISYSGRSYEEGKKIKLIDGLKYLYTTIKYRF